MSDGFWLIEGQVERPRPIVPKGRLDDRRVLSGILFVLRNGLRWRGAPEA